MTIVKLNSLRHHINRAQMEHFARSRSQNIYIFPALHSRTKSVGPSLLSLEHLLQQFDKGTAIPFPRLLLYTKNIPAILLTNTCLVLGLVNGIYSTTISIVADPTGSSSYFYIFRYITNLQLLAEFFKIDDLYTLCTKPPASVLFHQKNLKDHKFKDLDNDVIPIFPLERSITVKGHSIRRKQIPMSPAFSLTDYKIQCSMLTVAILDLKHDRAAKRQNSSYIKYCSTYVQLCKRGYSTLRHCKR